MLCVKALLPLWSLLTHMRISLSVIWFTRAFCVCTSPLMTPPTLIKKEETFDNKLVGIHTYNFTFDKKKKRDI